MWSKTVLAKDERPARTFLDRETGEYFSLYQKWVFQEGKTVQQVLLEIARELEKSDYDTQNAEDLLEEAMGLLLKHNPDADRDRLYMQLASYRNELSNCSNRRSQKQKNALVKDVIGEVQTAIQLYFHTR